MDDNDNRIIVSAEEYDRILAELERPPRVLPRLAAMLKEKALWTSGSTSGR